MPNPNPNNPQPSIEDIGLEKHLNDSAEEHNNFGYQDFETMVERAVNTSSMARAFGVSRITMIKWLSIYEKGKLREE